MTDLSNATILDDEDDTPAKAPVTRVGIMIDHETLGLGPKAVTWQTAFIAFDLDDPDNRFRRVEEYLPVEPQMRTFDREMNFSTIMFWMKQPDATRLLLAECDGEDFDELNAKVQSINRKMEQVITAPGVTYHEIWSRGINFDLPIWESLLKDLGQETHYRYDSASDLRTIMREAGITKKDVVRPASLPEHHALSDCEYQINCLTAAWRRIRATGVA